MKVDSQIPRENAFFIKLAVIVGLFALVLTPVLGRYFKEHAIPRWQLAFASNELDQGNTEAARAALDSAYARDSSILEDFHYVRARFELILRSEVSQPEEIAKFTDLLATHYEGQSHRSVSEGSALDDADFRNAERNDQIVVAVAGELLERGRASQAVRLLERLLRPMKERGSRQNNLLAYCRAVANQDLDTALLEINLALAETRWFDNAALLDTKAWVLYRRRENSAALEYSDRAIDRFYEALVSLEIPELAKALLSDQAMEEMNSSGGQAKLNSRSSEQEVEAARGLVERNQEAVSSRVSRTAFQEYMRTVAVMRLHRVRILSELGREEAADADRLWLRLFHFDEEKELH